MRGGLGSVGIMITSAGLNLVLAIILARLMGAEGFGIYSFIFALVTILAIPAQMGLPNLVVRETAKAQVAERWGIIKGLWRWSSLLALSTSLGLIALGALAAFVFADRLTPLQLATFSWALVLVPLMALGNLRGAALRGLRHVIQGQLPEMVLRQLFLIILILIFIWLFLPTNFDASVAMMLHVGAAAAAFAIGAVLLIRATPNAVREASEYDTNTKQWLASTLPFALIAGINQATKSVDLVLLGILRTSEEVGIYRIAMQGAELITFGLMAVSMVATPYVARLGAQHDNAGLQRLVMVCAITTLTFALPAFLFFLLFGKSVIEFLVGASFAESYIPLIILGAGQVARSIFAIAGILVSMTGYEREAAKLLTLVLCFNVALNAVLIPPYGANGAATATALAVCLEGLLLWRLARKRLGIETTILSIFK